MITCTFENNSQNSLRHATTGTILVKDNQILLVKRAEDIGLEAGKWCLPSGFLDRDETAEEGARREVLEETGHEASDYKLRIIKTNPDRPKEDRQNVEFVFVATAGEQVQEPDEESSEIRWFDVENLPPTDQIAFDHGEDLQWHIKHPAGELMTVGLSL